jgi:HPt (histidine-containing phosphotransfer) domain-containing protein
MLAHAMAGSCAYLGATTARTALLELEELTTSGRWPEVAAHLEVVHTILARVHSEVEKLPPSAGR